MAFFLESTKAKGLRFKIVKLDKATMTATLLGETGVPFDRVITEDVLSKFGYTIVKRADEEVVETAAEEE